MILLGTGARKYTLAVAELSGEGVVSQEWLIAALLGWMSEQDVKEFAQQELEGLIEEESEEDPLDDFNYVGARCHY